MSIPLILARFFSPHFFECLTNVLSEKRESKNNQRHLLLWAYHLLYNLAFYHQFLLFFFWKAFFRCRLRAFVIISLHLILIYNQNGDGHFRFIAVAVDDPMETNNEVLDLYNSILSQKLYGNGKEHRVFENSKCSLF